MVYVNLKKYRGLALEKTVLLVCALLSVSIALAILFVPEAFYQPYGISPGMQPGLVNELKASAGLLVASGVLMFAGVVRAGLARFSLVVAATVYLSYGLSRLLSFLQDGLPQQGLVDAARIELFLGAACLATLIYVKKKVI